MRLSSLVPEHGSTPCFWVNRRIVRCWLKEVSLPHIDWTAPCKAFSCRKNDSRWPQWCCSRFEGPCLGRISLRFSYKISAGIIGYVIEECLFGASPESNFVVIAWLKHGCFFWCRWVLIYFRKGRNARRFQLAVICKGNNLIWISWIFVGKGI